jgi:hypothetical protein
MYPIPTRQALSIRPIPYQERPAFRVVARVDQKGKLKFTATNAYSGNNGRAAILNNVDGADFLYTAGNAGNGGSPQPDGIIIGAGAQFLEPQNKALAAQNPGDPTTSLAKLQHYAARKSARQDWKR